MTQMSVQSPISSISKGSFPASFLINSGSLTEPKAFFWTAGRDSFCLMLRRYPCWFSNRLCGRYSAQQAEICFPASEGSPQNAYPVWRLLHRRIHGFFHGIRNDCLRFFGSQGTVDKIILHIHNNKVFFHLLVPRYGDYYGIDQGCDTLQMNIFQLCWTN